MESYISKIISKKSLTHDVIEIDIKKPQDFTYIAGQYVQIVIPTDDGFVRRSYSLSSAPHQETLSFCIKVIPEGVGSQYINSLNDGEEVEFRGPVGHFVPSQEHNNHYFIATGVGISPMIGMINDLLHKNTEQKVHLLFGLRFEDDLIYSELFEALDNAHENFSYQYTLTRPTETWSGLTGRVTEHLSTKHDDEVFYLCGSREMVISVRKQLIELEVEAKKIKFEIF